MSVPTRKISEIATQAGALAATDRLEVSQGIGSTPVTRYLTPGQITDYVEADADTFTKTLSVPALKVRGATSGEATIQAPSVAGTPTFTLPSSAGSAGEFLQTNGSGVLSWAAPTAAKYALIRNTYAGVGPDAPSSSYTKLTLNSEAYDPDSIVSLSSSVFTLVAGTYILIAQTMISYGSDSAFGSVGTQARIRNTSDSADVCTSGTFFTAALSSGGAAAEWVATLTTIGQVTIGSSKNFELQARSLGSPTYIQIAVGDGVNQVLIIKV